MEGCTMRHNCLDNLEWFEEEVPNGDNDMCVHSGYVCEKGLDGRVFRRPLGCGCFG